MRVLCMYLSSKHRGGWRRCFVKAKVLINRFNVTRLMHTTLWNFVGALSMK